MADPYLPTPGTPAPGPHRRRLTRSTPFALSAGLVIVLVAVMSLLPVPYVGLHPGPVTNTLGEVGGKPLILIEGLPSNKIYPTEGRLDLTTVSVDSAGHKMNLGEALLDWLDSDVAVVPRELIYPSNQSAQEVEQRNAEEMSDSQQNAIVAALHQLELPVRPAVAVRAVTADSPAEGKVHAGDLVLAVDGKPVTTPDATTAAVQAHRPGDVVTLRLERDQKELDVAVRTVESTEKPGKAMVGITIGPGHDYGFTIKIQLEDVGGPSAGLMFALGIYDKLTPGALTGGKKIAGTGTIDEKGKVGPIGGIQQKLQGAKDDGVTVFLVPAGNCTEAVDSAPSGLRLVKVETLAGAVQALDQLRTGSGTPPACTR